MPVVAALAVSVLVLAVPALVALAAKPAIDAALSLAAAGVGQFLSATTDNPFFWAGEAITLAWLGWLASLALRRRT